MKILIVDDLKLAREIEKAAFLKTNCEVLEASNGREALEVIAAEPPDLILMDLSMPEMDGCECCMAIKRDPSLKHIPVIMVLSANNIDDQGRCYAAGCDDYITKPIQEAQLLDKVRSFLDITKRAQIRVPTNCAVAFKTFGVSYIGRIKNISEGGLFVETSSDLYAGTDVKMKFTLPLDEVPLELEGEVVRVEEEISSHPERIFNGAGISFKNIPSGGRQCIGDYINFSLIYSS